MKYRSMENRFCMSLVAFAVIVRLLLATGVSAALDSAIGLAPKLEAPDEPDVFLLEILEPDWLALLKQWEQAPELPSFAPQDPEKLERIADYLDCSVDYLLGRTDNPAVNR